MILSIKRFLHRLRDYHFLMRDGNGSRVTLTADYAYLSRQLDYLSPFSLAISAISASLEPSEPNAVRSMANNGEEILILHTTSVAKCTVGIGTIKVES